MDPREQPAYTLAEAAHYLVLPASTVRSWSVGAPGYGPLIEAASHSPALLSFLNLAELHVLAAIRRTHLVAMGKVRGAIQYLVGHARSGRDRTHPLISREMETDGLDLFIRECGHLVNISEAGQLAMREVLDQALRRIDRDPTGVPIRLYPFTRAATANAPALVVVDPSLSAGRPVIAGTGLATGLIAERYKAGESVHELARDYERSEGEIEEAIRCELPAAA
ncbi:MAG: DUF433 domain-containing protein [Gammaproteobacteria bacterium]|nr:DUF433 domain-containing protein [Gammaproteobacteria bacterium]MYF31721.1 DUF433 domain-containing protein [Gammaproteobacteria bacterium]MYK46657.1 DUF433 domain-containing protein [Gammaproteobacteria bacterium]